MITHVEVENTADGLTLTDKSYEFVPEFQKLKKKYGEKGVIWVVCLYDYWSPYRALDMKKRMSVVGKDLFQNTKINVKFNNCNIMKAATEKYKELQYDPILDSYNLMSRKTKAINTVIENEVVNSATIKNIQESLRGNEKINEMVMKMQNHIDELSRKSPFRGFSSIEDYHSIEN